MWHDRAAGYYLDAGIMCVVVQVVDLANGESVKYDKLCVCIGAKPKVLIALCAHVNGYYLN